VRHQTCLLISVGRARDWCRNGVMRRLQVILLLRALTRLTVYFLLCLIHHTPNLSLRGQVLGYYLLIMSMTIAIVSFSNLRSYCKVERSTCHFRGPSSSTWGTSLDGNLLRMALRWGQLRAFSVRYLSFSFACLMNLFYQRPWCSVVLAQSV
jgi:hypothetical protein